MINDSTSWQLFFTSSSSSSFLLALAFSFRGKAHSSTRFNCETVYRVYSSPYNFRFLSSISLFLSALCSLQMMHHCIHNPWSSDLTYFIFFYYSATSPPASLSKLHNNVSTLYKHSSSSGFIFRVTQFILCHEFHLCIIFHCINIKCHQVDWVPFFSSPLVSLF